MSQFPWNEETVKARFWDRDRADAIFKTFTLKERLANTSGANTEELLRDCAHGLALVMEQIEKLKNEQ